MNVNKRNSRYSERNYMKFNLNRNDYTPIESEATGYEVILEYLKQKDVAPWFRGTSHFHIQGADKLFSALRDDREQKTTHRIRMCLSLIGLKPLITPKQIMLIMRLSRGNDLIFLWFLMELYYKTPKHDPNSYSVNEQLICSAICHLDMIPTLRELDKILPNIQTTVIKMKKEVRARKNHKELFLIRNNENISNEFVLPYFEKYKNPELYGKSLFLQYPTFKVKFNSYSRYKKFNYTFANEPNQWYAEYRLNISKRIAHSIIYEAIKNMFYNLEAVSFTLGRIDVMCAYHKANKIMRANNNIKNNKKNSQERLQILKHKLSVKDVSSELKRIDIKVEGRGTKTIVESKKHPLYSVFGNKTAGTDPNMKRFTYREIFVSNPEVNKKSDVKKSTKKAFSAKVQKFEIENHVEIEAEKSGGLKNIIQHLCAERYSSEEYLLMDEILVEAFQYLRKSRKFVWAQLPAAHRIPFLREWVARRFGKEYSSVERAKSYQMSCIIFRALNKIDINLHVPNANQISKQLFLRYNCRNHVDKKVQSTKSKYYHLLDSSLLERTRIFWFAMRGYLCSNGPPRKSFFAYMPSRHQDIHHFRSWKSIQYRNFKFVKNNNHL